MDYRFQWFIKKILDKIKQCPKFYGQITISFQSGKPTHIKFEETEKFEGS